MGRERNAAEEKPALAAQAREEAVTALPRPDALALIENLGAGVCFTDRDGIFVYVNSLFARMLGYSADELIGHSIYETVIREKDLQSIVKKNERRLTGIFEQYEIEARCKNGSTLWGLVTASPLKNAAGEIVGTVASVTDVSAQRKIFDALEHQKTFLRHVIDTSPDLIFSRDSQGRYTLVNKAMAEELGMDPREVIGKTVQETVRNPALLERILREDREVIEKCLVHYERDTIINHPVTDEERHFQVTKMPLIWAENQKPQVLGILTDFTEERRLQLLLRDIVEATAPVTADDFFRSLVQHLARALGTKWAFVGRLSEKSTSTVEMLAFWDHDHFREKLDYSLANTPSETIIGQEIRVYPSGAKKLFPHDPSMIKNDVETYMGAPLFDSNGHALGILSVMHDKPLEDLAEKKSIMRLFAARAGAELERLRSERENELLQKQLMQSQKMEAIGQLVAGIAHDLNNALGAISGHLQLLDVSPELSPALRHSVEVAFKGTERASSLIEHLLQFSRKSDSRHQPVSLRCAVTETLEFLGRIIPEQVQISCMGSGKPLQIMAHPAELQQLLTNLVINAVQAMPNGGQIYFNFSSTYVEAPERLNPRARAGLFTTLSVRDTGMGIPKDNLDKVFDPFFTTKKTDGGTGLGLAMVYAAMQRHGGWVEVDSKLGSGTVFRLFFPPLAEKPSEEPVAPGVRHECREVMVIDDDAFLVDLTRKFLEISGIPVYGFTQPAEALAWYQENLHRVGLVVMDLRMPGIDGLECFRRLRKMNSTAKIIVLSGLLEEKDAASLQTAGALKILQKPLRYPDLVKYISDTLAEGSSSVRK